VVSLSERDWQLRVFIYESFVETGRPPAYPDAACHFGLADVEVRAAYHRLHDEHALFLEPGTDHIRIANPLSAVPTPYRVQVNGRRLYANCAWDALGIPAMLHADALIDATYAHIDEPVRFAVEGGALTMQDGVVHFALPFRRWYDDLLHT
jgi:hypothetical protein